MTIQARGLCRGCYRHQRFIENPAYAENYRAQEREAKRKRRLADEAWAEKERSRDRSRKRVYTGNCELCGAPGCVAKALCRRCYGRISAQARRAENPELAKKESTRNAVRLRRNADAVRQAKNAPCSDCGGHFPPEAMDLDHVRGEKVFNLSSGGARSIELVMAEIAKCDVVCANCHRIRTKARAKGRGMV